MTLDEISRLLFERWDPIEVNASAPSDEYLTYAGEILAELEKGEGGEAIFLRLKAARTGGMLLAADDARDRAVAAVILDCWRARTG